MRHFGVAILLLVLVSWPVLVEAQTDVRVATWNIMTVGTPGSIEYDAALDVLARIGADVVGINEVLGVADIANFQSLAADGGYTHTIIEASSPLFGVMRNAFMSKFPFAETPIVHTSDDLSGDLSANDMTRRPIEIAVDVPGNALNLRLVVQHWKSGGSDEDDFRRAVESIRISQALLGRDPATEAYVVLGDVNEQIDLVPRVPNPITSLPAGLPGGFNLGSDLAALLPSPGIENDPFFNLDSGLTALDALQLDGKDATLGTARIDYILVSTAIDALGPLAEVYDSADEGLPGGLPKFGSPVPASTSLDAADHFMVFADITVPAAPPPVPLLPRVAQICLAACFFGAGLWQQGAIRDVPSSRDTTRNSYTTCRLRSWRLWIEGAPAVSD